MSMSLADLSVGGNSNVNVYSANNNNSGYQEYVSSGHGVSVGGVNQVKVPPISAAPGSATANQLGDLSMLGGGKGLSWGTSSNAESG